MFIVIIIENNTMYTIKKLYLCLLSFLSKVFLTSFVSFLSEVFLTSFASFLSKVFLTSFVSSICLIHSSTSGSTNFSLHLQFE